MDVFSGSDDGSAGMHRMAFDYQIRAGIVLNYIRDGLFTNIRAFHRSHPNIISGPNAEKNGDEVLTNKFLEVPIIH